MKNASILSQYPRTEVQGKKIFIINEDGEKSLWGTERSNNVAEKVADDIQLSLRAINPVEKAIFKKINEISDDLMDAGIPEEYVGHFIIEGYESIKEVMANLHDLHLYANYIINEE